MSMKRVPWQIEINQAAVEFAEFGRIAEFLRIYLAYEAGQSHDKLLTVGESLTRNDRTSSIKS